MDRVIAVGMVVVGLGIALDKMAVDSFLPLGLVALIAVAGVVLEVHQVVEEPSLAG